MITLKQVAHDWLPPAVASLINKVHGDGIEFYGDYVTWEEARAASKGYDREDILARVQQATLKVKNGEAVYERDSVIFDHIEYSWAMLAGLMWTAARQGGKLDVLDFGGSLGSSYFQNRKFLESMPQVRWSVVEQEHFVVCGQKCIQDERLRFYRGIDECRAEGVPNVVLLSSVLQYIENPHALLSDLLELGADCVIIDRTPFSMLTKDRLVIQQVPDSIYPASYPCWILSRSYFIKGFQDRWNLLTKFDCPEGSSRTRSGVNFSFDGLLFESRR